MNKIAKRATVVTLAFCLILLGAVLPQVIVKAQDMQLIGSQKMLDLQGVDFSYRQENGIVAVLELLAQAHNEIPWSGDTHLTQDEACQAAQAVIAALDSSDLLPLGVAEQHRLDSVSVEPQLVTNAEGNSALIWACSWDSWLGTNITLDDATGKAVRILVSNVQSEAYIETEGLEVVTSSEVTVDFEAEKWAVFLQDYYDLELLDIKMANGALPAFYGLQFSSKGTPLTCELNLIIETYNTLFNYYSY